MILASYQESSLQWPCNYSHAFRLQSEDKPTFRNARPRVNANASDSQFWFTYFVLTFIAEEQHDGSSRRMDFPRVDEQARVVLRTVQDPCMLNATQCRWK
jgi:hypothetical protein